MIGVSKWQLGADVVKAIAEAKNEWADGTLRKHDCNEISDPHIGSRGAKAFEFNVGLDRAAKGGSRRLVLKEQSGRIEEVYFSDNHYRPGSWVRILDF